MIGVARRFLGRSKFVRDAVTLQVAGVMNQASQIVSTALIAFLLGAHGQGLFSIAIALQGLAWSLINVGVAQAAISQIGGATARQYDHKTAAWISFFVKATVLVGVAIVAAGWFVLPWAGEFFYEDRAVGVWAWWLCFQPLIELPKLVGIVAFQGTRRMLALGQLENSHELVRLFLVVGGALLTGTAEGAVLGTLAAGAFGSVLACALYARARADGGHVLPSAGEILRWLPEVPLRKGLRLGLRVGLVKNAHVLVMDVLPRIIIGSIAAPSYTAYFHIAHRILGMPTMIMQGISRTMLPALGELAGLEDRRRFTHLFVRVTTITGALISGGILLCLPLIPFLARLFFPEDYAEPVFHYAWILAIGRSIFSFAVALEAFYIAANKVKLWLWLSLIGSIVTVPINVWLILNVEVWGTAWGITVYQSWILVHLLCVWWMLTRARPERAEGVLAEQRPSTNP
jgi:O-antigen/teichoic acid export membrane protein